ncbi:MAG: transposase [Bryobacteraceae bacterium]
MAYLLTFSAYGTHLPGSEKGWVDAQHRMYGSPILAPNPTREAYWGEHLKETPWPLDAEARRIVLQTLRSVCHYREWTAHALHVRTTHVHAVVGGEATPERMLSDYKAYATRALRDAFPQNRRRRYWTNHGGSTRYLWNEMSLRAAMEYVLNGQGEKMAWYAESEPH